MNPPLWNQAGWHSLPMMGEGRGEGLLHYERKIRHHPVNLHPDSD